MIRSNLNRFIAKVGIVDASIILGRGPLQLERWRDGQDEMPQAVADWLEAKVLIERWRRQYNTIRPHSSLGYRPPAPQTIVPWKPEIEESLLRESMTATARALT